jgi:signal transduction histidine kinase
VTIRISVDQEILSIAIADNGRGISAPNHVSANPLRAAPGFGLDNLQQRMADIHGTCVIIASPAGGTTVTFTVPLVVRAEGFSPPS